jgi:hypothetical protein
VVGDCHHRHTGELLAAGQIDHLELGAGTRDHLHEGAIGDLVRPAQQNGLQVVTPAHPRYHRHHIVTHTHRQQQSRGWAAPLGEGEDGLVADGLALVEAKGL